MKKERKRKNDVKVVTSFRIDAETREILAEFKKAWKCSIGEAIRRCVKYVSDEVDSVSEIKAVDN